MFKPSSQQSRPRSTLSSRPRTTTPNLRSLIKKISTAESAFRPKSKASSQLSEAELKEIFKLFDLDGDKKISLPDLMKTLIRLGLDSADAEVVNVFNELDKDPSESIDEETFLKQLMTRKQTFPTDKVSQGELLKAFKRFEAITDTINEEKEAKDRQNKLKTKSSLRSAAILEEESGGASGTSYGIESRRGTLTTASTRLTTGANPTRIGTAAIVDRFVQVTGTSGVPSSRLGTTTGGDRPGTKKGVSGGTAGIAGSSVFGIVGKSELNGEDGEEEEGEGEKKQKKGRIQVRDLYKCLTELCDKEKRMSEEDAGVLISQIAPKLKMDDYFDYNEYLDLMYSS